MTTPSRARRRSAPDRWLPAVTTVAVTVWVLWPLLRGRGAVLFLDLVVLPEIRLPASTFLLGPDIVRRFPLYVPLAALGAVTGGLVAWRIALVALLVAAGVGMARLCATLAPNGGALSRAAPAALLIGSPFVLTRLSTGHVQVLAGLAVLPWLIAATLDPRRARRVGKLSALCGLFGPLAGTYALVTLVGRAGTTTEARRALRCWLLGNLVWIVPGVFLSMQGLASFTGPEPFRPGWSGVGEALGLPLGTGYWDHAAEASQGRTWTIAVVSLLVVGFAAAGWAGIPAARQRALVAPILVGYGVPVAASVPGLASLVTWAASTPVGLPFREPHRLIGLGMVPTLACAGVGLARLVRRPGTDAPARTAIRGAAAVGVAAMSIVLADTGLGRVHQRLEPLELPPSWSEVKAAVQREPGSTLVLPWHEYVDAPLAGGRRVYNPIPDFIGGDVIASADPLLGPPVQESVEPRAERARALQLALRAGLDPGDAFDRLGVTWVVVLHANNWEELRLEQVPSLTLVQQADGLDLYRHRLTDVAAFDRWLPFAGRQQGDGSAIALAGERGWFVGWHPAGRTPDGLIRARGDGSVVWFPAGVVGMVLTACTWWYVLSPRAARIHRRAGHGGRAAQSVKGRT